MIRAAVGVSVPVYPQFISWSVQSKLCELSHRFELSHRLELGHLDLQRSERPPHAFFVLCEASLPLHGDTGPCALCDSRLLEPRRRSRVQFLDRGTLSAFFPFSGMANRWRICFQLFYQVARDTILIEPKKKNRSLTENERDLLKCNSDSTNYNWKISLKHIPHWLAIPENGKHALKHSPIGTWTSDLPHGSKKPCIAQCARPSISMSGREATHSLKNACDGLSDLYKNGWLNSRRWLNSPSLLCKVGSFVSW